MMRDHLLRRRTVQHNDPLRWFRHDLDRRLAMTRRVRRWLLDYAIAFPDCCRMASDDGTYEMTRGYTNGPWVDEILAAVEAGDRDEADWAVGWRRAVCPDTGMVVVERSAPTAIDDHGVVEVRSGLAWWYEATGRREQSTLAFAEMHQAGVKNGGVPGVASSWLKPLRAAR